MTTLRLMTYNMLHAPGDRLDHLVGVVREVEPDVLACQEINTYEGMMALSRELSMLSCWGPANSHEDTTRDGEPLYEHLAIFTRLPPRLVRVHQGDLRAMFRPVLEVRLQPEGLPELTIFTVHLRAVLDASEPYLKLRELGALLTVLGEATGHVVALGDFNARPAAEVGEEDHEALARSGRDWPEDHVAAVLGRVVGAIESAGFTDSYRLVNPYTGAPQSSLVHQPRSRVDYVFVNAPLVPHVSASVIHDSDLVQKASDHRPVVTELTWS